MQPKLSIIIPVYNKAERLEAWIYCVAMKKITIL